MKRPLKIAIAGLGTVGSNVVQILESQKDHLHRVTGNGIELVAVSARSKDKDRGFNPDHYTWYENPVQMAEEADVDVIVELIGGEDGIAKNVVETALETNADVVTANKALLAKHGNTLAKTTSEKGLELRYEAAVAGGVPIIKAINEGLVGNTINAVYGILNGTSNYILTQMEQHGTPFEDALADAQTKGYAEADPTLDINGGDASHKLAILSSIAFGHLINTNYLALKGIEKITPADFDSAKNDSCTIKLIGAAKRHDNGTVENWVQPAKIPLSHPLAGINGTTNAVFVQGNLVPLMMSGPGAGGPETASAVVADLVDLAHDHELFPLNQPATLLNEAKFKEVNLGADLPTLFA